MAFELRNRFVSSIASTASTSQLGQPGDRESKGHGDGDGIGKCSRFGGHLMASRALRSIKGTGPHC
jgi:hypothetical protein